MPKHALDPSVAKVPRVRKTQRICTGNDGGTDGSDSKSTVEDKDLCISLKTRLAVSLFDERPARHELTAVEYIVSLRASSLPTPKVDDFKAFMKAMYPSVPDSGVARSWNKLKAYFTSGQDADYEDIQSLIDIPSLVAAFHAAPQLSVERSGLSTASTSMPLPTTTLSLSSSSRPSRASSSCSHGSNGSNRSSNGNSGSSRLQADQVAMMHELFKYNFEQFSGQGWTLPSGATIDSLLYGVAMNQHYETTLHSFVVEDAKMVLQLSNDDGDRDAIKSVLIDRAGEHNPPLSAAETAFLSLYCRAPDELDELLSTYGWRAMGAELDEKPTEEFRRVTHECVWAILTAYRQVNFSLLRGSSESWVNHRLWWFLSLALFSPHCVKNEPGEIVSQASQHRRNEGRTLDSKQLIGHNADGLVYGAAKNLEYCVLEMAKEDQNDTRKLAKMMKDVGDEIRKLATVNVRDCLVVYGMRIAGPTATFYTLRQRPGRFSQLCNEGVVSFPAEWVDVAMTKSVLAVLARVLVMRKAIVAMAGQVPDWTVLPLDGSVPEDSDNGNWMAATLTSPPYTASQPATPIEDIPPLVLDATTN
ncbi:hypothetical protein BGZ65_010139 [Modicella reniformis]|uniref:Uncharacterized protein n=1 Tax=Modicella reniformis TaxID=1440133 RepID=A0A9P6IQK9_9FUNG|nr:hypothetical protein BGZ65_010139 [Modicella reniformis]